MRMTTHFYTLLLTALLTTAVAQASESGSMIKADELKAEPYRDAKTLGKLTSGDKLTILKKDGGWLRVKSARGTGWVRMLSVRRGTAGKASSNNVSGLAGLASGRSGTGKVVATTGIRGLNEEELKAAKFNEAEIKLAESYLTSRSEAQTFARKGKLKSRSMDYLPDPGENK